MKGPARALNAELTEGLVTRTDLDAAESALKTGLGTAIRELEHKVNAGFAAVDGKFAAVDAKFDAMDAKFDAKFEAMDAKFDAMDAKFEGLSSQFTSQGRYVFLALALIASLGLYNAIAPLVVGKAAQQSGSSQPVAATAERESLAGLRPSKANRKRFAHGRPTARELDPSVNSNRGQAN